jgi:Flp pilus assembly protein TadD
VADTLGWVLYLSGEVKEAIPLLEKAKAGQGPNPTVRYHLGMAYLKAGRQDDARAELHEALAISSTFPEADEATKALGGL